MMNAATLGGSIGTSHAGFFCSETPISVFLRYWTEGHYPMRDSRPETDGNVSDA